MKCEKKKIYFVFSDAEPQNRHSPFTIRPLPGYKRYCPCVSTVESFDPGVECSVLDLRDLGGNEVVESVCKSVLVITGKGRCVSHTLSSGTTRERTPENSVSMDRVAAEGESTHLPFYLCVSENLEIVYTKKNKLLTVREKMST